MLVFFDIGYLEWKKEKFVEVGEVVWCFFFMLSKGDWELFERVWLRNFCFLWICFIFVVEVFFIWLLLDFKFGVFLIIIWLCDFFFGELLNWDKYIWWVLLCWLFWICRGFNLFGIVDKWLGVNFFGDIDFGVVKDIGGSIFMGNFLGLEIV